MTDEQKAPVADDQQKDTVIEQTADQAPAGDQEGTALDQDTAGESASGAAEQEQDIEESETPVDESGDAPTADTPPSPPPPDAPPGVPEAPAAADELPKDEAPADGSTPDDLTDVTDEAPVGDAATDAGEPDQAAPETPVTGTPSTPVEEPVIQPVVADVGNQAAPPEQVSPSQPPAPVVESTVPPVPEAANDLSAVANQNGKPPLSPLSTQALQVLDAYEQEMKKGKPITDKMAGLQQKFLLTAVCSIINKIPHNEFEQVFKQLLKKFEVNTTGSFHESRLFQAMAFAPLEAHEMIGFQKVIDMIKTLAAPAGRDLALKQINMKSATDTPILTDIGRNRLFQFFGL